MVIGLYKESERMAREIKFRGKRVDNGEWVYGFVVKNLRGNLCIQEEKIHKFKTVISIGESTVGQYTGLRETFNHIKPSQGKEIFTGDLIKSDEWDDIYEVIFEDGKFRAKRIVGKQKSLFESNTKDLDMILYPWIIGNKFDNPELLKEEE